MEMKRTGKMYKRLLFSMFGMLAIPICIISGFYIHLYQKMDTQIKENNSNFVETVKNVCDKELEYYQDNILRIAASQNLKEMEITRKYDEYAYYYQKYLFQKELLTELSVINMNKNYCSDIFVYFGDPQEGVVCSKGTTSLPEYIQSYANQEDYKKVEEFISKTSFRSVNYVSKDNAEESWVLLTSSINTGESKIIAGLWLDMNALMNLVGAMSWQNGMEYVILDEANYVICSSFRSEDLADRNLQPSSKGIIEIGKEKYIANILESESTTWKYALMIPMNEVYRSINNIRNIFAVCILLCFLIGYRFAIKSATYNYDPIKDLISIFDSSKEENLKKNNFDEYQYLKNKAENLISSGESARKQIKKYRASIKAQYLKELLFGTFKEHEAQAHGSNHHNEKIQTGKNQVIVIHWKSDNNYSKHYENEQDLCKFAIINVFSEGLGKYFEFEIVELQDSVAIILLFEKDANNFRNTLCETLEYLHDFLYEQIEIDTLISIGEPHEGTKGVHESYVECLEVQGFFKTLRESCILYSDIREKRDIKFKVSFEREERIANAIRENDVQTAIILIEEILREVFSEDSNVGLFDRKCVIFDLYCMLLKLAGERGVELPKDDVFSKRLEHIQWREFSQKLEEMIKVICDTKEERKINLNRERCLKIKRYIEDNFHDINLNVSQIGAYFEMSPSYLSSLYRKEMGESLVTVINKVRIQNAAVFLKKGNTVNETALRCGFTDCSAFIRIFKKYMGITPGQYKGTNDE